jgi:hypothetical protein
MAALVIRNRWSEMVHCFSNTFDTKIRIILGNPAMRLFFRKEKHLLPAMCNSMVLHVIISYFCAILLSLSPL